MTYSFPDTFPELKERKGWVRLGNSTVNIEIIYNVKEGRIVLGQNKVSNGIWLPTPSDWKHTKTTSYDDDSASHYYTVAHIKESQVKAQIKQLLTAYALLT